jgi:hypothetical protein
MIAYYLWRKESKDEESDENASPQVPNLSSIYELISEQTELNHAAFAAVGAHRRKHFTAQA